MIQSQHTAQNQCQCYIIYSMAQKQSSFYLPQNYTQTNSSTTFSRNHNVDGVGSEHPFRQGHTQSPESVQHKLRPPLGSKFSLNSQYKNYPPAASQIERPEEYSAPTYKYYTSVFSESKRVNEASDLRCSIPASQSIKPKPDFLRLTSFTPKLYGTFQKKTNGQNTSQSVIQTANPNKQYKLQDFKLKRNPWADKVTKVASDDSGRTQDKPLPYSPPSDKPSRPEKLKTQSPEIKYSKTPSPPFKNDISQFLIVKTLGSGKFADVFQARHISLGFVCALKRLSKEKIREYQMHAQVTQQIKIHSFISHPNIVQFYGLFSDCNYIYIILEYLEGGTLFEYLGDKHFLEEPEAVGFLRQVSAAVTYIHNKGIAHRDIKPENIIASFGTVKLCDFGWSARVLGARKTYCGTFDYAPPEILQKKEYDQTVDLWCVGVLAFQLLTNRMPFEHKQRRMTMYKILNVERDKIPFPQNIGLKARDFIEALVRKNPEERLKAYRLLQHPFLDQYQEET